VSVASGARPGSTTCCAAWTPWRRRPRRPSAGSRRGRDRRGVGSSGRGRRGRGRRDERAAGPARPRPAPTRPRRRRHGRRGALRRARRDGRGCGRGAVRRDFHLGPRRGAVASRAAEEGCVPDASHHPPTTTGSLPEENGGAGHASTSAAATTTATITTSPSCTEPREARTRSMIKFLLKNRTRSGRRTPADGVRGGGRGRPSAVARHVPNPDPGRAPGRPPAPFHPQDRGGTENAAPDSPAGGGR
jgi:hypothetical protein